MEGLNALVTGASSGLGLASCEFLLENGATVNGFSRSGANIVHGHYNDYCVDITNERILEEALSLIESEQGSLDLVIHAAGALSIDPLIEMPTKEFEMIIQTNLTGSFHLLKHVSHYLSEQNPHLIVLSGQGANRALPNMGAFSASQAGLHRLVEEIRYEYRAMGARVSLLTMGAVDTPIWKKFDIQKKEAMLSPQEFTSVLEFLVNSPPVLQFNEINFQHLNGYYGN